MSRGSRSQQYGRGSALGDRLYVAGCDTWNARGSFPSGYRVQIQLCMSLPLGFFLSVGTENMLALSSSQSYWTDLRWTIHLSLPHPSRTSYPRTMPGSSSTRRWAARLLQEILRSLNSRSLRLTYQDMRSLRWVNSSVRCSSTSTLG